MLSHRQLHQSCFFAVFYQCSNPALQAARVPLHLLCASVVSAEVGRLKGGPVSFWTQDWREEGLGVGHGWAQDLVMRPNPVPIWEAVLPQSGPCDLFRSPPAGRGSAWGGWSLSYRKGANVPLPQVGSRPPPQHWIRGWLAGWPCHSDAGQACALADCLPIVPTPFKDVSLAGSCRQLAFACECVCACTCLYFRKRRPARGGGEPAAVPNFQAKHMSLPVMIPISCS